MTGDDKIQTGTKISTDMIKPFNGEGDVASWLKKVELVGNGFNRRQTLFVTLPDSRNRILNGFCF